MCCLCSAERIRIKRPLLPFLSLPSAASWLKTPALLHVSVNVPYSDLATVGLDGIPGDLTALIRCPVKLN